MTRHQARKLLATTLLASTCVSVGAPLFMVFTPGMLMFFLGIALTVYAGKQRDALGMSDESNPVTWMVIRSEVEASAGTLGVSIVWLQVFRITIAVGSLCAILAILITDGLGTSGWM